MWRCIYRPLRGLAWFGRQLSPGSVRSAGLHPELHSSARIRGPRESLGGRARIGGSVPLLFHGREGFEYLLVRRPDLIVGLDVFPPHHTLAIDHVGRGMRQL